MYRCVALILSASLFAITRFLPGRSPADCPSRSRARRRADRAEVHEAARKPVGDPLVAPVHHDPFSLLDHLTKTPKRTPSPIGIAINGQSRTYPPKPTT